LNQKKRSGYNKNSVAAFSSRGPTEDGRRKPDVCGVGEYLYHAQARYPTTASVHADMTSFRGTSFSTPLLAAHAALVRQYFLTGHYPSGTPIPTDQCTPSGALIKALFIHSTRSLSRVVYDAGDQTIGRVEVTEYGDFIQGYGRVVLSDTIQFQQTTGNRKPLSLYLVGCDPVDESRRTEMVQTMTSTGESHQYEVILNPISSMTAEDGLIPLKVTLAYTVQ
jgi:subtilisin family serine protease